MNTSASIDMDGSLKPRVSPGLSSVYLVFLKSPDGVSYVLSVVVVNVNPLSYISISDTAPVSTCYAEDHLPL